MLTLFLAACGQPPDGVLRMGLNSAPTNLDPRFATDATSERINRLLYRRLVDFDEAGMPVPSLASWQRMSPLHYRFTLGDEGRRFQDGRELRPQDVKVTYDYILDKDNGSPHRAALELVRRIEVVGPEQIDFFLHRVDPLFPAYLAIGILPADLITSGHPFSHQPVGSGPFRFDGWPEEGRLRLLRNRDNQLFEFLQVKDPSVRILKLLRGEIDMIQNDLPPELLTFVSQQEGIRLERRRGSNFSYLGFNLQDPDTGKLKVRQAVAHAIDREAIIRYMLKRGAIPAQALLPSTHWAGVKGLSPIPHDPSRARALLAEAGYSESRPLRLTYKTSSDPFRVRLATVIQNQLAQVGIQVDLRSYDWGTFFGDIKAGVFQMYSLAWVGIKTPDIFRYIFHSDSIPPGGANRGRYRSPKVDRLIEAAEEEQDLVQKAPLYRKLQRLLLEELPYVPLWYEDHIFIYRDHIQGYHLASDGNYDGLIHVSGGSYAK